MLRRLNFDIVGNGVDKLGLRNGTTTKVLHIPLEIRRQSSYRFQFAK